MLGKHQEHKLKKMKWIVQKLLYWDTEKRAKNIKNKYIKTPEEKGQSDREAQDSKWQWLWKEEAGIWDTPCVEKRRSGHYITQSENYLDFSDSKVKQGGLIRK